MQKINTDIFMTIKNKILLLSLPVLLAACAAPSDQGKPARTESQIKKTLEVAPEWFANPPHTANEIYVTGSETSSNMQMAVDKSVLVAKRALVAQIGGYMSGISRQVAKESNVNGKAALLESLETISKSAAVNVNVSGFTKEASKIVAEGGNYRAYVLLSFPLDNARRVFLEQIKNDASLKEALHGSKAMADLEAELNRPR